MYPLLRFLRQVRAARRAPRIGAFDTHVSAHRCWPWDIDPWRELNNGRTLTLYDLGRIPMAIRTGLAGGIARNGWGLAVAGVSVRYRRRIRAFERFTMTSRLIGWDGRFFYMEQAMWTGGECANHMLLRAACTAAKGGRGIVPPAEVARALGLPADSPSLPGWVLAWIEADAQRPWPPAVAP